MRNNPDAPIVICLFVATALTRLLLRTQMLWTWDSANFAMATRTFDVTQHFPHPPGYFYFVNLARLFDYAVNDVNLAFILENVLFSALSVVAIYYLGKTLYNRTTGVICALFLAFSVTFWTYGLIALTYPALCFFTIATAYFAYKTITRQQNMIVALTISYAIGGGFRPDLLLFLAPLYLVALIRQKPKAAALSILGAVVGLAVWLVPTVWLSGGIQEYLAVFSSYTSVDVVQRYSVLDNGLEALQVNVRDTLSYLFYATYAIAALLPLGLVLNLFNRGRWISKQTLFLAGWIAPMVLFYIVVHVGDTGFAFTILPALCIFAARTLFLPPFTKVRWRYALAALVIIANIAIFCLHDRPLTLQGVRRQDQTTAAKIEYIQKNYDPSTTLLVSYELYRHLMFYLPNYESMWIDVFGRGVGQRPLAPGLKQIVLVDPSLKPLNASVQEVPLSHGSIFVLPVTPGQGMVYSSTAIILK